MVAVALVIVVAIIVIAYFGLNSRHTIVQQRPTSAANSSSTVNTTSVSATTTITSNVSTGQTLSSDQVASALGAGWTSTGEYNYNSSAVITFANGSSEIADSYGNENFSNSSGSLITGWIHFKTPSQAAEYVQSTFSSSFPTATNSTLGTDENATYIFYSGQSVSKDQPDSLIYAHDGPYAIVILGQGVAVPKAMMEKLLSDQLANLGIA